MNIAVLDDDEKWLEVICDKIKKYMCEYGENQYKIETHTKPDSLLERIMEYDYYDIFLLDIRIGRYNGIELLRDIQRQYVDPVCILITNYLEYAPECYQYNLVRYILKTEFDEKFSEAFDAAVKIRRKQLKQESLRYFSFRSHDGIVKLFCREIYYIQKDGKNILIHCDKNRIISQRENLKAFGSKLEKEQFAYSDRSYIVNLAHVHEIKKDIIVLDNEEKVPLSRGKAKDFNDLLWRYLQKHA